VGIDRVRRCGFLNACGEFFDVGGLRGRRHDAAEGSVEIRNGKDEENALM
jgi:hypothetical protein